MPLTFSHEALNCENKYRKSVIGMTKVGVDSRLCESFSFCFDKMHGNRCLQRRNWLLLSEDIMVDGITMAGAPVGEDLLLVRQETREQEGANHTFLNSSSSKRFRVL